jgi:hypothetical protein
LENKWARSNAHFKAVFTDNQFGHDCSVCDRLWHRKDLTRVIPKQMQIIAQWYNANNVALPPQHLQTLSSTYSVCSMCHSSLSTGTIPRLATVNGFMYTDATAGLPPLDTVSERLISPRLPFMQVRRLR